MGTEHIKEVVEQFTHIIETEVLNLKLTILF